MCMPNTKGSDRSPDEVSHTPLRSGTQPLRGSFPPSFLPFPPLPISLRLAIPSCPPFLHHHSLIHSAPVPPTYSPVPLPSSPPSPSFRGTRLPSRLPPCPHNHSHTLYCIRPTCIPRRPVTSSSIAPSLPPSLHPSVHPSLSVCSFRSLRPLVHLRHSLFPFPSLAPLLRSSTPPSAPHHSPAP